MKKKKKRKKKKRKKKEEKNIIIVLSGVSRFVPTDFTRRLYSGLCFSDSRVEPFSM